MNATCETLTAGWLSSLVSSMFWAEAVVAIDAITQVAKASRFNMEIPLCLFVPRTSGWRGNLASFQGDR